MSSFEQKLNKHAFTKIVSMVEQIDDKPLNMPSVERDNFAEELVDNALRDGYSSKQMLDSIDLYVDMCSHSIRMVTKTSAGYRLVVDDDLLFTRKIFCHCLRLALLRVIGQEKIDSVRALVTARVDANLKAAADRGRAKKVGKVVADRSDEGVVRPSKRLRSGAATPVHGQGHVSANYMGIPNQQKDISVPEDGLDNEFVLVQKNNGKSETGSYDDGWEMV